MKAEEKLDQEVDRLWQQMRYAYEHGGGHAGHLNNAWHTAMRLSKELRRLHNEVRVLTETLQRCKEVGALTAECYRLDLERDEALLRQARVMRGLLRQCAEVLCTVEPESDTEGEGLYALLHGIQGVIEEPKAKGALL